MVVAVRHFARLPRLAGVGRLVDVDVQHPDGVFHLRVGEHARVVERALPEVAAIVHFRPGRSGVVGPEEAAVIRLNLRVHAARVGAGDRQADLAEHAPGQTGMTRDLGPMIAAVGRREDAAARPAARHLPGIAGRLPERDVQHARVVRIDDDLVGAGPVVAEQDLLPGLPAVFRPVDAALRVRRRVMTERGDVHEIRVGRIDPDLGDHLRLGQADMRPCLAAVRRLVRAVALNDVAANVCLAGADVDHVRVRRRDRDRANRRGVDQSVGDRPPGHAAVGCLPQTAAGGAHVVLVGSRDAAGHGNRSTAASRSHAAPAERAERSSIGLLRWGVCGLRVDAGRIESSGHRRRR